MTQTHLSAAQKMTIDIAIASLDFLKAASQRLGKPVETLTALDLKLHEKLCRAAANQTTWNDGESDSDWSDRVEHGKYDPITDTVH